MGYVTEFIKQISKRSQVVAHQLIWNMQTNMFMDEDQQHRDRMLLPITWINSQLIFIHSPQLISTMCSCRFVTILYLHSRALPSDSTSASLTSLAKSRLFQERFDRTRRVQLERKLVWTNWARSKFKRVAICRPILRRWWSILTTIAELLCRAQQRLHIWLVSVSIVAAFPSWRLWPWRCPMIP